MGEENMIAIMLLATIILPIVIAVIELVKATVPVKKNYIPITSFVIGIVIGFIATPFTDLDLMFRLWAGAFAGLASGGSFDLIKKTAKQIKGDE